jgi:hypothetical protein
MVTVRGEAYLDGPPDLATLSCTVHRQGGSAAEVEALLAEASQRLSEVVRTHSDHLEEHSTSGLHVSPVFSPETGATVDGFRGTLSAELVVADVSALPAVVFALAVIEGSQLDGPYWSLRRDNPLHRQARLAAIVDAQLRAADYAAAFGATLVDLVEVSDLESGFGGPQGRRASVMAFAKGSEGAPPFDFQPARQTVSGQVTVRFTLTVPDLGAGSPT